MKIAYMHRILDRSPTQLIGFPIRHSTPNACTGEPLRKSTKDSPVNGTSEPVFRLMSDA